jgi:hypothetical protein
MAREAGEEVLQGCDAACISQWHVLIMDGEEDAMRRMAMAKNAKSHKAKKMRWRFFGRQS